MVKYMRGQRCLYQELVFNLNISGVNRDVGAYFAAHHAAAKATWDAANPPGPGGLSSYVPDAGNVNLANQVSGAQELPFIVRMQVVLVKGKDINTAGNLYKSFGPLVPFPEASSKFVRLYDKSFSVKGGTTKPVAFTLPIKKWLSRRQGRLVSTAVTSTANGAAMSLDQPVGVDGMTDFGGPCQAAGSANSGPWKTISGADVQNLEASTDSYLSGTDRIVVLFSSSDNAVGGFAADHGSNSLSHLIPPMPHVAISGFIRAKACKFCPLLCC